MNSTKLGIEYLPKPFWKTTSTDIISIKERRIGVIDGPISRRLFDYFDEYKNFTSENDEYSMNTHSAIVSSIIKDIYLPSKLYVTQVECGGSNDSEESMVKALEWLVIDKKIEIVNISLGFYNNCKGDCLWDKRFKKLNDIYNVIIVVSGGNTNESHKNDSISCPGCAKTAITVGALNLEFNIDKEMNLKPIPELKKPDIYANGYINITMSDGYGWNVWKNSGTSFSSPIIVGLIAKYYDEIVQTPEFTQIKNFLSSIDLFLNKKGLYNEKDKIKEIFKPKLKASEKENSCYLNKENIISFLTELTPIKEKKATS